MDVLKKLEVRSLSMSFGKTPVLDSLCFDVCDGEFLAILGPSGCGKTTLLRILIGLLAPTSGNVYEDGVDITALPPAQRGMGIVFQNYALFENMTVLRNVEYALTLHKSTRANAREKAMELLSIVGMDAYAQKRPVKLSGGQQQRVAIARTLALNPSVILMDEPMSALDIATRLQLRQEIKSLQSRFGTTILYITHDQEEAIAMSDRIMIMERGHIHQIDTPENILSDPADDFVQSFVLDNLQLKVNSLNRFMEATRT